MTGDDAGGGSIQEAVSRLPIPLLRTSSWAAGLARAGPPDRTRGVHCSFPGLRYTLCGCHVPASHGDLPGRPPGPKERERQSEFVSEVLMYAYVYMQPM